MNWAGHEWGWAQKDKNGSHSKRNQNVTILFRLVGFVTIQKVKHLSLAPQPCPGVPSVYTDGCRVERKVSHEMNPQGLSQNRHAPKRRDNLLSQIASEVDTKLTLRANCLCLDGSYTGFADLSSILRQVSPDRMHTISISTATARLLATSP